MTEMSSKVINMGKRFFIAGCGGLGCYIVENLIRLGADKIVVCDADVFSESNLDRQLYSMPASLGKSKVECAKKRAEDLGFNGEFIAVHEFISEDNIDELLNGCDVAIDALDNTKARFILEDACERKSIPMVHGAVAKESYQVAVVSPGSKLMHTLYGDQEISNATKTYAFTVASCAATQSAEGFKLANGEKSNLENKLLMADLYTNTYEVISL